MPGKCINYCMHCRKLKCIHYSSCNFILFTFHHKRDSICKTITPYNLCGYKCWYTSSILLDNKPSDTISWQESHEKLVRYTSYVWYCVISSILNKVCKSNIYAYILIPKHTYYLEVGSLLHVTSYFWWCGGYKSNNHIRGGGWKSKEIIFQYWHLKIKT